MDMRADDTDVDRRTHPYLTLRRPKVGCTSGMSGICQVPVMGMPVMHYGDMMHYGDGVDGAPTGIDVPRCVVRPI